MKKKERREVTQAKAEACVRCGYSPSSHSLANFSDGPLIGIQILICPSAIYKAAKDVNAVAGDVG